MRVMSGAGALTRSVKRVLTSLPVGPWTMPLQRNVSNLYCASKNKK